MKSILGTLLLMVGICTANAATASLIELNITGEFTYINPVISLGIDEQSSVVGTLTYDSTELNAFQNGFWTDLLELNLHIGPYLLTEDVVPGGNTFTPALVLDTDAAPDYLVLTIQSFAGFNQSLETNADGSLYFLQNAETGEDYARFTLSYQSVVPVPLPGAIWFLLSGVTILATKFKRAR